MSIWLNISRKYLMSIEILFRSWKRQIRGKFVLERHLKKGSVFISMDDEQVYQVSGIVSSWKEMLYFTPVPVLLEAVLIPFRDVIISDGLVIPYKVEIGKT